MIVHSSPLFSIYFGDKRDSINPQDYKKFNSTTLFDTEPFSLLKKRMSLQQLFFLHQVHGKDGKVIESESKSLPLFVEEGDYLITNNRFIGLGVATADCLPVIFFDKAHHAIGIAHVGWRGAFAGIVTEVIQQMQDRYATQISDIEIFFGPSVKHCCYEVDASFIDTMEHDSFALQAISQKSEKHYFDLPKYVTLQLYTFGITEKQIGFEYNTCTMCNDTFCSYRRDKGSANRQITVVSLK
jgi:hypothetical protein